MRLFDAILDANHRAIAGDSTGAKGRGARICVRQPFDLVLTA
jgi:hypothetical protein